MFIFFSINLITLRLFFNLEQSKNTLRFMMEESMLVCAFSIACLPWTLRRSARTMTLRTTTTCQERRNFERIERVVHKERPYMYVTRPGFG